MSILRNMAVCCITDVYFYAEDKKIAGWNEIQDLIFHENDYKKAHGKFFTNGFILTNNFFNEKYMDDAYGLSWHPKVRQAFEGFLKDNKLKKVFICVQGCSLSIL